MSPTGSAPTRSIATCWAPNWCARAGWAYRFGDKQLNVHGNGVRPAEVARLPVQPGNSDLCFEWMGPIEDAIAHLKKHNIAIEAGPMQRFGAKGDGTSVYFRDPDGSLMEFIVYGAIDARLLVWAVVGSLALALRRCGRGRVGAVARRRAGPSSTACITSPRSITSSGRVAAPTRTSMSAWAPKATSVRARARRSTLTLASAGQTAKVVGVSRLSVNVEMTGGIELQGKVNARRQIVRRAGDRPADRRHGTRSSR